MQMWVSEVSEVMVLEDFFPFSSDVEAIMFFLHVRVAHAGPKIVLVPPLSMIIYKYIYMFVCT